MSVLVVGLNHKGAPLATLERVALVGDALDKLLHDVSRADDVAGALVLSTCNRVEIYAEVGKFHGSVAAICELLSRHSQVPQAELTQYLYVHYEDRALQHMLAVACGLDSMVIGESQILGQLRQALRFAREAGTLGPTLSDAGSLALRAGKRAQSETSVGQAGASLVSVGLQNAARHLGAGPADQRATAAVPPALTGLDVLVVGAGAMSGLAVASVARAGASSIVIANRTRQRAERLAATVGGRAADMSGLTDLIAAADLVVTCTGAAGHVITAEMVATALSRRPDGRGSRQGRAGTAQAGRPAVVLLDLAMPRDVEPAVADLPAVVLTDLATVADEGQAALGIGDGSAGDGGVSEASVAEVRRIIAEELAAHRSANRAASVSPTVVALRAKAASVVDAELARLAGRLSGVTGTVMDGAVMDEVAKSMRRVTDKLLHDPTVRVKELAGAPGADTYEDALRVLFDLDPATVQAVAQADVQLTSWPQPSTNESDRGDVR
jgi:glutamyl-tRNA reductase